MPGGLPIVQLEVGPLARQRRGERQRLGLDEVVGAGQQEQRRQIHVRHDIRRGQEIRIGCVQSGEEPRTKRGFQVLALGAVGHAPPGGPLRRGQAVDAADERAALEPDAGRLPDAEGLGRAPAVLDRQRQQGQGAAGGVAGDEHGVRIDRIVGQVRLQPAQGGLDVGQLALEIGLRCRPVVQGDDGEALLRQMRVEVAVELLVSVAEPAAVDVHVHRRDVAHAHGRLMRQVDVEQMPAHLPGRGVIPAVRQIGDVRDDIDVLGVVPPFGARMVVAYGLAARGQDRGGHSRVHPVQVAVDLGPPLGVLQRLLVVLAQVSLYRHRYSFSLRPR